MKKIVYLLCFISIFKSPFLFALNNTTIKNIISNASLNGIVTDAKTNQPLLGAYVFIPDLKLSTVTDATGHYFFYKLPKGSFLLEVKFEGYKTVTRSVSLQKDVTREDFILQESATEMSEVVVTGSSKAMQIRRSPIPIVSISHDYLTTNLSTNAIDAIAKVPGVRAISTGPNVSKPSIRGLGYNRVLTLYDGIRQEGQQWGDEHGIEIDQFSVDKVEIIKGPASLSYGSDALAGVVNLIPTQAAAEGKMAGSFTTDYQTNNKHFGGSLMLGATKNGCEWMARLSHKQAVDYQNRYDGRVFNTGFNETDASLSIGLHRKWGYSHLSLVLYNDLQEIPDGSRDDATRKFTRQISEDDNQRQIVSDADLNSYSIEKLHQHVQHYKAFLNNSFIVGDGKLDVNFGFQNSTRREFSHPILYQIPGLYLQLQSYTYDVKYHLPEFNKWNISVGVNGMYQQNTVTNGTEFVIPNFHQFDIGAFTVAKKSMGKLDISVGMRTDVRTFNNSELYTATNPITQFDMPVYGADTVGAHKAFGKTRKTFAGVSGSAGFTYNFSDNFSVKANIARGFRSPNIAEISSNGVHPGTGFFQIGNADFKPEFSLQEDIGFVYTSKNATIQLDVFNNFISNYIYNQKILAVDGTDSVTAGSGVPQTFQFQASRANLYGAEMNIDFHPTKAIHFENSISIIQALNKGQAGKPVADSEKYLPFIPPTHGTSELRYDFDYKTAHLIHAFVKAQVEYYAAQNHIFSAYATETATPDYTLVNAGMGGSFTNRKGKPFISVYIMCNNLLDVGYQDHLSRLKYFTSTPNPATGRDGIYNMGRNICFKINVPFSYSLSK